MVKLLRTFQLILIITIFIHFFYHIKFPTPKALCAMCENMYCAKMSTLKAIFHQALSLFCFGN